MHCTISWENRNLSDWMTDFANVRRSNLLQCYNYAHAVCPLKGQKPRWAWIEIDGQKAGLFQILEASLFGRAIHAVILDRGPLWLDGYGSEEHIKAFLDIYARTFPKRFGRKHRFIPEIKEMDMYHDHLQALEFKRAYSAQAYETVWLNLEPEIETIHQGLKKNWRGSLSKAQKSDISLSWGNDPAAFSHFIKGYNVDKAVKGYDGASEKLMNNLYQSFSKTKDVLIGQAFIKNKRIASIFILRHGQSATYQAGWTSDQGRKNCAMHVLLWEACKRLKDSGIKDFDLGGVNEDTAKNIKKFKQGTGGELVRTMGVYT